MSPPTQSSCRAHPNPAENTTIWCKQPAAIDGLVNVDDPEHCEFALLRDALIRVYLCDLKETTAQVHYENYRRQHLSESSAA